MKNFNEELYKDKYKIKSTRLPNYDYSGDGWYYITICTKDMVNYFGEIRNFVMGLNDIGCMVAKYWQEIPKHFSNVRLDEWVVMPNHVHGIVIIDRPQPLFTNRRDAINRVSTGNCTNGGITGHHNPMGKGSLGEIIRWFKGRTSFEIHKRYPRFQWQPRFYDQIITGDKELLEIREYIYYNPQMWDRDRNKND